MVEIRPVVRILESNDELLTMPTADGRRPRGLCLGDVLAGAGRAMTHRVHMTGHEEASRTLFLATRDPRHRDLAAKKFEDVSVAHLSHLPAETRVLIGVEIHYSPSEAQLLAPDGGPRRGE